MDLSNINEIGYASFGRLINGKGFKIFEQNGLFDRIEETHLLKIIQIPQLIRLTENFEIISVVRFMGNETNDYYFFFLYYQFAGREISSSKRICYSGAAVCYKYNNYHPSSELLLKVLKTINTYSLNTVREGVISKALSNIEPIRGIHYNYEYSNSIKHKKGVIKFENKRDDQFHKFLNVVYSTKFQSFGRLFGASDESIVSNIITSKEDVELIDYDLDLPIEKINEESIENESNEPTVQVVKKPIDNGSKSSQETTDRAPSADNPELTSTQKKKEPEVGNFESSEDNSENSKNDSELLTCLVNEKQNKNDSDIQIEKNNDIASKTFSEQNLIAENTELKEKLNQFETQLNELQIQIKELRYSKGRKSMWSFVFIVLLAFLTFSLIYSNYTNSITIANQKQASVNTRDSLKAIILNQRDSLNSIKRQNIKANSQLFQDSKTSTDNKSVKREKIFHNVKKGEGIDFIADKYDISVLTLMKNNPKDISEDKVVKENASLFIKFSDK